KEKMKVQINQIWQYAQSISDTEDDLPEPPDLTTIDKEKVGIAIAKLNEALADKENIDKKVKAKLNYINKNFIKNIQKYEQQEAGTSTDSNSKLMLLNSEQGIAHRKKRCHDVEPVFGNIKHNHGFRRFMLRGKKKVEIEWGLISIAHNIRKKEA
ncbi:MAG: transposase, partial [Bacteroidetes bacterium]|nr:transposase [Bacteroidota bacterium]